VKRWLTYLLLLITMAGTFYPCCMRDNCLNETAQQKRDSQQDQQEKGTCSPFFACGACAALADLHTPCIALSNMPAVILTHHSFYLLQLSTYCASTFQPPRFS
jgi:hypothetical protein